ACNAMRALNSSVSKGLPRSKTASIGFASSNGLFRQLLAFVDNFLMKSAQISAKNGDLPRFGL
ncbi:hypothetical protein ABTL37_19795, partial [Acinetobacter baumannii]